MPSKRPARSVPRPAPRAAPEYEEDDVNTIAGEDEAPPPRSPRPPADDDEDGPRPKLRGGWTEAQKQMDSTSGYAQTFKPDENTQFVKFLDDLPYANFKRHWVERASTTPGKRNVRAYTCLKSFEGKECPLCKIGEKPQAVAAFNIAIIGDDGQVLLKSWDAQPRIYNVLKAYSNDPKIAPLTKGFFMVSKSGGGGRGGTTQYNISPIRASSLQEDYDVTVPTQEEFDAIERYTPEIVTIPTMKELRDLATELAEEDYED